MAKGRPPEGSGRGSSKMRRPDSDTRRPSEKRPSEKKRGAGKDPKDRPAKLAGRAPQAGDTKKVQAKKLQGAWGDLPDYVMDHGRGSMPTVPEKYRRYLEALVKETGKADRKTDKKADGKAKRTKGRGR